MTQTIPRVEPAEAYIGDTISFDISLSDYPPADGWTLSYAFRGPTDWDTDPADVTAGDGSMHEVRIPPARTDAVEAGTYQWFARVENADGEVHTVRSSYDAGRAPLVLLPDPAAAVNAASHAKRTLEVLEAAIEGRLTSDMQAYTIQGRAVTKIPMNDLVRLRGLYVYLVEREKNPGAPPVQHIGRFRAG